MKLYRPLMLGVAELPAIALQQDRQLLTAPSHGLRREASVVQITAKELNIVNSRCTVAHPEMQRSHCVSTEERGEVRLRHKA